MTDVKADFHRIVYAESPSAARAGYTAFERKWMPRCPGVVRSLQERGEELLTFFQFPEQQWRTLRATNVIERLNEEFRRRVKTQGALPTEDAALVLLFGLVVSGQIRLRCLDGGARSPPCFVKAGGRRHDTLRFGRRSAFDGPTRIQVFPRIGLFLATRPALCCDITRAPKGIDMEVSDPAKLKAQKTYDAAADLFDARPLGFWARYGERTIERLHLKPGATVLDVACGTGASALPAAVAVGPSGRVIGVDLAEKLLTLARQKARQRGLGNVEFRQGDMTMLGYHDGAFDAVVCVFGIFFVKDMETLTADLWRMVKPGGRLAITTWGPRLFAPMYEKWNETVRALRADLVTGFNPWDRITTPDAVQRLFADAAVPDAEVRSEAGSQLIDEPDDVWTVAAGSGLRWVIEQMGPDAEQLRKAMVTWAQETRLAAIETNVIYAAATRR